LDNDGYKKRLNKDGSYSLFKDGKEVNPDDLQWEGD
jgi:hypothetical protein